MYYRTEREPLSLKERLSAIGGKDRNDIINCVMDVIYEDHRDQTTVTTLRDSKILEEFEFELKYGYNRDPYGRLIYLWCQRGYSYV